ncbi:MAG: hypothetical protein ABI743_10775, partial [bacterium]
NLLVLALGWSQLQATCAVPAPSPTAPFLHATYLFPAEAIGKLLPPELIEGATVDPADYPRAYHQGIVETEAMLFSLDPIRPREGFWAAMDWLDIRDPRYQIALFDVTDLWVVTSTRDLTSNGERAAWEAYLADGWVLDESWEFIHEDPLWYWVKTTLLHRDVAPYKRELRHFTRVP